MALSTIYLTTFKTYFNRSAAWLPKISQYSDYVTATLPDVNFNPNDGLNTTLVFNMEENVEASYLIVLNEHNEISSRWYIMEKARTTYGQYTLQLHRDTVCDTFGSLMTAPMFIEKGTLRADDPMIFNSEGMTFNQIKKKEILLKDKIGCPWIVGYYSKKGQGEGSTSRLEGTAKNTIEPDISLAGEISKWHYYQYVTGNFKAKPFQIDHTIRTWEAGTGSATTKEFTISGRQISSKDIYLKGEGFRFRNGFGPSEEEMSEKFPHEKVLELDLKCKTEFQDPWTTDNLQNFLLLDGQTIQSIEKGGVKKLYRISIQNKGIIKDYKDNVTVGTSYYTTIKNTMQLFPGYVAIDEHPISVGFYSVNYRIQLEDITEGLQYSITENRFQCNDAPYDIFAIPYGEVGFYSNASGSTVQFTTNRDAALTVANNIAEKYSGTYLYDLQMLPYCPVPSMISDVGNIRPTSEKQYSLVRDESHEYRTFILNLSYSQFTTNIALKEPIIIKDPKVESQTDICRLSSPNYNGQFEFNPAKNGGVSFFNVDCTYKPYSPYIHVNPNFGKLYGEDFDDARGLICGGDFSLATVTDQWKQYELNNKNYLNSFNRQIENMETSYRIENQRMLGNATLSTVQSGLLGAIGGGKIGSAIGTIAGMASTAWNYGYNQQAQREALDYSKDQFEFSMGNIQALPYSLNRVSAYTANNKYFPFLEIYSCTDEEKEALKNKIKYRGMTVGRIGTLREFIGYAGGRRTFIQAKLIRLEINEDAEYIATIAEELGAGMYFEGGY